MVVTHSKITDTAITIMLEDRSICQLELQNAWKKILIEQGMMKVEPPIFWFNRLKAMRQGEGRGTFLMNELVKILDEKKITVVNSLNPYGNLDLEKLTKFYEKFGFISVEESFMIRPPKTNN